MDEIAKKIASLGLPGIILIIAVSASGIEGAYGVIAVLSRLGGPFGLVGGLAVLGLITAVGDILSGYGIDALLGTIYKERSKSESLNNLVKEIKGLPISDNLKLKLETILSLNVTENSHANSEPRTVEIVEEELA